MFFFGEGFGGGGGGVAGYGADGVEGGEGGGGEDVGYEGGALVACCAEDDEGFLGGHGCVGFGVECFDVYSVCRWGCDAMRCE